MTRRSFLNRNLQIGAGVALATLVDIPLVMKRALAESSLIGSNGKKLLFIFLRGANDGLNSVIPILDPAYAPSRPLINIPADPSVRYDATGPCLQVVNDHATDPTYQFASAIPLGNSFAALHPSLRFLANVYNAGDLALVHRVGYPGQNRSHFESQANWESGAPNRNRSDGLFYRALNEAGLVQARPLSGVSIQSALPLLLQGADGALTNIVIPSDFEFFGVPGTEQGKWLAQQQITAATTIPFASQDNRALLRLHYLNLIASQRILANLQFEEAANTFVDDELIDQESEPYSLFPTIDDKNGGYQLHGGSTDNFVVDRGGYYFFRALKAASLILNQTDAVIAGTEILGWDTHYAQGGVTGPHANLVRYVGWALYALRKYFMLYGKGGPRQLPGAQARWEDVVVVTLSEFGRTTVQNGSLGTDHAEASVMFLAGGAIKAFNAGLNLSGVYGCSPSDDYNGQQVAWQPGPDGSMFRVNGRYLQRAVDFRSVLGKLIRDHLGVTQAQLNRIIPGYADPAEALLSGGTSIDGTTIVGELDLV